MGDIFITSDWHFCHNKDFLYKPRGFDSPDDMNNAILFKHNLMVRPDDDVYVLGDLMLSDSEKGMEFIRKMNGRLHIVRGNHDTPAKIQQYLRLPNLVEIKDAIYLDYKKYHFYLSHFPTLTGNYDDKGLKHCTINLCGHSHTIDRFSDWDKYNSPIYHVEMDCQACLPVYIESAIEDIKMHLDN